MGDAAMLMTTVGMLRAMAPGASICALVSHPDYTRQRCPDLGVGLEEWPWPVPGKKRLGILGLVIYPLIFFSNLFSAAAFRLSGARVFILNGRFRAPLSMLFDSDVVIHPGGDFISPNYFFMTTFGEILMAKILGKRTVILAQSMGPFEGLLNRAIAAPFLRMADLIIVREGKTALELERMGVTRAHLTADLAFAFPGKIEYAARGERVVICPKNIPRNRERYALGIRRLAKRIKEEFGFKIVLLPTDLHDVDFQSELGFGLAPDAAIVRTVHPQAR